MIKRHFVAGMLMLMSVCAMAIPAKRGLKNNITLADGTKVQVTLVGDEFIHYWQDDYGNKYIPAGDQGIYKIADATELSKMSSRSFARKSKANARRVMGMKAQKSSDVFKGKKKGLVILVEYTDVKFKTKDAKALFERISNEEGYSEGSFQGSVKDYFLAQSRGQFELDFDVVGPVALSHNMKYYGGNDYNDSDKHPEEMVTEACKSINKQVNFADYDWDGDGEVEQVYVIYAGYGEADTGKPDTVWPHEWQLSGTGNVQYYDGVKIDTYACSSELDASGDVGGIGTMCHEFSHCMGIPDMYDTEYSGNFGMGPFDLMDYGAYMGDGYQPAGYTSYEMMISGWLEPVELRKGDELTVSGMKALSEGGEAYKIVNSGNENEYYLVENRQFTGWDASLPQSGVLVTHVDYDPTLWSYNMVNTTGYSSYGVSNSHQRMTILHADNDDDSRYYSKSQQGYTKTTYQGDPYPYQGNDSITSLSKPSNSIYTANEDGGKFMDIAIRNIAVDKNGLASMTFGANVTSSSVVVPSGGQLFKETFDKCLGTGGNDGLFGGSSSIAQGFFTTDNAGWSSSKSYGGYKCARFGNSSTPGTVTTPSFEVYGSAVLTFNAAPWGSDPTSLELSVSGNATVSPSTITMSTGVFKQFTATITGSGPIRVKFTPKKRLFLDEVYVTAASTAVKGITNHADKHIVGIYTLDGTPQNVLGKGINIVRYSDGSVKKVLR